jgi:hypothetical protein
MGHMVTRVVRHMVRAASAVPMKSTNDGGVRRGKMARTRTFCVLVLQVQSLHG